jgi:hypothetical protein
MRILCMGDAQLYPCTKVFRHSTQSKRGGKKKKSQQEHNVFIQATCITHEANKLPIEHGELKQFLGLHFSMNPWPQVCKFRLFGSSNVLTKRTHTKMMVSYPYYYYSCTTWETNAIRGFSVTRFQNIIHRHFTWFLGRGIGPSRGNYVQHKYTNNADIYLRFDRDSKPRSQFLQTCIMFLIINRLSLGTLWTMVAYFRYLRFN